MAEQEPQLKDPDAQKLHEDIVAVTRSIQRANRRNGNKQPEASADDKSAERVSAAQRIAAASQEKTPPKADTEQPVPNEDDGEQKTEDEPATPSPETEETPNEELLTHVKNEIAYYDRHIEYLQNRPLDAGLPREIMDARKELNTLRKKEQELEDVIQSLANGDNQQVDSNNQDNEDEQKAAPKASEPKLTRKEFVAKQEEEWGANDDIKPEGVHEGELTYEQYKAVRPKEGIYHESGRFHDTRTGKFASQQDYEKEVRSESDGQAADRTMRDYTAHEEALEEHEKIVDERAQTLRALTEGELLVRNNPDLQGLVIIGQELLGIGARPEGMSDEEYETRVKPRVKAKEHAFKTLLEYHKARGLDASALAYIDDSILKPLNGEESNKIKGSPYYNDEKVTITNLHDESSGSRTYSVERSDGSEEDVQSDQVEFRQEFDIPKEEKKGMFERLKGWWGKNREQIREYGGKAWFAAQWDKARSGVPDFFLNAGTHKEGMTPEQIERRRKVNRVTLIAGGSVLAVGGLVAAGMGVAKLGQMIAENADGLGNMAGSGLGGSGIDSDGAISSTQALQQQESIAPTQGLHDYDPTNAREIFDTGSLDQVQTPDTGSSSESVKIIGFDADYSDITVDNLSEQAQIPAEAFNIPKGMGGEKFMESIGLDARQWYNIEEQLLSQFGNDFYRMDSGHVGFSHSGQLSQGAVDFFTKLKQGG